MQFGNIESMVTYNTWEASQLMCMHVFRHDKILMWVSKIQMYFLYMTNTSPCLFMLSKDVRHAMYCLIKYKKWCNSIQLNAIMTNNI